MNFPSWVGPRFADTLTRIHQRPSQQFDWLGLATGPEGFGKSTFLIHVGLIVDPSFKKDPLSRIVYNSEDFIKLGNELEPGQFRLLDEGDEGAYSLDYATGANKNLSKHLFRCRELRLLSGIAIPNIRWMAPIVKEHRANHWGLMVHRGDALMHTPRRADYDGAKAGWRQLFHSVFPEIKEPWFQKDYRGDKRDRLQGLEHVDEVDEYPGLQDAEVLHMAQDIQAAELLGQ